MQLIFLLQLKMKNKEIQTNSTNNKGGVRDLILVYWPCSQFTAASVRATRSVHASVRQTQENEWRDNEATHTVRDANERGSGWNPGPQRSFADRKSTDSDRGLARHQITCWFCANASDSLAARAKIMPTWMKGRMSWSQPKPMLHLLSGRLLWFGFYGLKQGSYLHYCYYLWWIAPCCLELLYIRAGWSFLTSFSVNISR